MSIERPYPEVYELTIYFRDGADPIVRTIVGKPETVDGYLEYQVVGETGKKSMQLRFIIHYELKEKS